VPPSYTPNLVDLLEDEKRSISTFLKTDPKQISPPAWGVATDGSLRAGVIHTIEFSSELLAILRSPKSEIGLIESLAFSTLGASGKVSMSFDEGRTTFIAESNDGQLSRLIKIRIGRIACLWNRAKHVIVYERTVVPSAQFENQQKDNKMLGW